MMRRAFFVAAMLLALPAAAQSPVRVGPLDVRNALGEIAAAGTAAQAAARANLGILSLATQGAGAVAITGGTISGADTSGALVAATGGTAPVSLAKRLRVFLGPDDFWAVGDGTTNDLAALTSGGTVHRLGAGIYYTGASVASLPSGRWYSGGGGGRFQFLESGVSRSGAPNVAIITAAPARNAGYSESSALTAFDADFSLVHLVAETRISGTATLGQPTTTYQLNPSASQVYLNLVVNSGWNQSTSGNIGRTGVSQQYMRFSNGGPGDTTSLFCNGFVTGVTAGATSFLANGSAGCLGGQMFAGANGVYLQGVGDINLVDAGFDVSGIGVVVNSVRTNGTGALGATWMAIRPQSQGTVAIDAFYSAGGIARIGVDFAGMTLQDLTGAATKSAITLKAGQAIYGNATNGDATGYAKYTVAGTEWLSYEAATGWNMVVGSTPVLQASAVGVSATQLRITAPSVPSSSSTACTQGQIAYDSSYFYTCVATNTWKRAALASW